MSFPREAGGRYLAVALGLGATATLIASWGELGLMLDLVPPLLPLGTDEIDTITILMAVVVAPFVEELAKPLGCYILWSEERSEIGMREWALLGLMAGLGFAIVENIMYAGSMLPFGTGPAMTLLALRFMLPLHMLASAMSAFGFGLWARTGQSRYFLGCLLGAMFLHGLFNLAAVLVG